jgi:hypothetical protein
MLVIGAASAMLIQENDSGGETAPELAVPPPLSCGSASTFTGRSNCCRIFRAVYDRVDASAVGLTARLRGRFTGWSTPAAQLGDLVGALPGSTTRRARDRVSRASTRAACCSRAPPGRTARSRSSCICGACQTE